MKQAYTLSMDGQGLVTLPKSWRDRIGTNKLMATEEGFRLILEPCIPDSSLKMITANTSFDFLNNEPDLYSD